MFILRDKSNRMFYFLFFLIFVCFRNKESSANASINISLTMDPQSSSKGVLCPGDRVELYCRHSETIYDPSWRVRGKGLSEVGLAQFGTLPNHSIVEDTRTREVLRIDPLRPDFNGYTYLCLYSILGVDVTSSSITLNIIDARSAVSELRVENITESSAYVKWNYTDPCDRVDWFELSLEDFTGALVFTKNASVTSQGAFLMGLMPEARYKVTVKAVLKDKTRSDPVMDLFNAKPSPDKDTVTEDDEAVAERSCEEDVIVCGVVLPVMVIMVVVVILLMVIIVFKAKHGCSRDQPQQNECSSQNSFPSIHQTPPPPNNLHNGKSALAYQNMVFQKGLILTGLPEDDGTFV